MGRIKYVVEVQGHEPPFKWRVLREGSGMGRNSVPNANGEADSITDARFEANEAARAAEEIRRHSSTKQTFDLFEVEEIASLPTDDDVLVMESDPHVEHEFDGA